MHSHSGHSHGGHDHSHDHSQEHGHTHEIMENPGFYAQRQLMLNDRDFSERAFTIGIGGPVGSGKTALMLKLCQALSNDYSIACVTNDIFTREDCEVWSIGCFFCNNIQRMLTICKQFLVRNKALPPERIRAIETGSCPHAAIREDISQNLQACEGKQIKIYWFAKNRSPT